MASFTVTHSGGLFSCCSVTFTHLTNYLKENKDLPTELIRRDMYGMYKTVPFSEYEDISLLLFDPVNQDIDTTSIKPTDYHFDTQFERYKDLSFADINPITQKYFSPSREVKDIIKSYETKYNIDYDNTASVFYRGNDKIKEVEIGSYDKYFEKSKEILSVNPNIKFLIQTDEKEFREEFLKAFPNSFYINELPVMSKNPDSSIQHFVQYQQRPKFAQSMLAATIIVSKCKYLITHTGNCGLWAVHYRGNIDGVHQLFEDEWI